MDANRLVTDKQAEEMIVLVIVVIIIFGVLVFGWVKLPFMDDKPTVATTIIAEETDTRLQAPIIPNSPDLGKTISFLGYAQGRGWEGKITKVTHKEYEVLLTKVVTNTENYYELFPQACSGMQKLTSQSVGASIVIPKSCLAE